MLRCYIACSYLDRDLYERLARIATGLGYEITYRWPDAEPPPGGAERHKHRAEQAALELDGIAAADVLIVGLPGRYGTASELGAALAFDVPVVLFGAVERNGYTGDSGNILHDHPGVEYVSADEEELVDDLRAIGTRVLADEMSVLIGVQLAAPYDSWSTAEHREALAKVHDDHAKLTRGDLDW